MLLGEAKSNPSRRNSGLEATAKHPPGPRSLRSSKASRTNASTQFPLPMGTVDLLTTTVKCSPRCSPDPRRSSLEVLEVGVAVREGRSTHRDKDHVGLGNGFGVAVGEGQALGGQRQELLEARLVDGGLARFEGGQFGRVDVHTGDVVPQVS